LDSSVIGSEFIGIHEADESKAAIYTIAVTASDIKTGEVSDLSTFTVTIRLRAVGLNIVSGTEIADFTYLVGSATLLLDVPEYFYFPDNANTDDYHSLGVTTPIFVTLVGNPSDSPQIQIGTSDPSSTGIYSIDVTFTDTYSGLSVTNTFVLTVSCVQGISQPTSITPVEYFITDTAIPLSFPFYSITPANCPYEIKIDTVTLVDGSALPNTITFNGVNNLSIYETDYQATGVYDIKVTALDPKSKIKNFDLVFRVTVKCTKTIDVLL
jgi:hypothetical protein